MEKEAVSYPSDLTEEQWTVLAIHCDYAQTYQTRSFFAKTTLASYIIFKQALRRVEARIGIARIA